ncbi:hypothetical protein [Leuconostoc pseudomesenteroides]|uniref:hypothetical protein n=1 Tax=Leuconostoc pseudomesenteroides TaxID=33968 RepID=UPI004035B3E6
MNTITIIVLVILGFFALIQILISVALKNIAEILTIASSGLKTVYKINEGSHSSPIPTIQFESEHGPINRPPKPTNQ